MIYPKESLRTGLTPSGGPRLRWMDSVTADSRTLLGTATWKRAGSSWMAGATRGGQDPTRVVAPIRLIDYN
ncbi:unnamed protein product [Nezara viridula]|uniref:Uncharacterized protein n=1 Tax=Nezara viridula TaxID=85310 RepID=A0A9P0HJ27_NEZVI|nr:unnamed protein product [Nezara viridula]